VYELTDEGRATMGVWLAEMLAEPKQEFPQFPAALSFVLMLEPREALEILERRAATLAESLAGQDKGLAEQAEVYRLPRVTMLEGEYLRAMTAAELDWIKSVTDELRSGKLSWTFDQLIGFAQSTGQAALVEPERLAPRDERD
jgi:hypothetical protein